MNRTLFKVILIIFLVLGGFYIAGNFFNIGPLTPKNQGCPPSECKMYKIDETTDLDSIGPQRPPRSIKTFNSTVPEGFPANLPVDQKPVRILESYSETMKGDSTEGESYHTQLTYNYITEKETDSIFESFRKYLQENTYDITVFEADSSKNIKGKKSTAESVQIINISIYNQSQLERFVSVSIITSFLKQNP